MKRQYPDVLLTTEEKSTFQSGIYSYYRKNQRNYPWRLTNNPYHILVSEIMLQQTQTERVVPKYQLFLDYFPDIQTLAHAELIDVLRIWHGLGYNRRALMLKKCAETVLSLHAGKIPDNYSLLRALPGVGTYTAAALLVFAFGKPYVMIETNIRTVYIHTFFSDQVNVDDRELTPYIEQTIDIHNPRHWYYALMDYGVLLKKTIGNKSRQSKHYVKQSPLIGSDRQIRANIIKELLTEPILSIGTIQSKFTIDNSRLERILAKMQKEGLIIIDNKNIKITASEGDIYAKQK